MPLHVLQLDPGTEYLLPWTRNKLNFWHAESERSGQTLVRKTVQVSDGSVIHAWSQHLGGGVWMDKIRITGRRNLFILTLVGSRVRAYSRTLKKLSDFTLPFTPGAGVTRPFVAHNGLRGLVYYESDELPPPNQFIYDFKFTTITGAGAKGVTSALTGAVLANLATAPGLTEKSSSTRYMMPASDSGGGPTFSSARVDTQDGSVAMLASNQSISNETLLSYDRAIPFATGNDGVGVVPATGAVTPALNGFASTFLGLFTLSDGVWVGSIVESQPSVGNGFTGNLNYGLLGGSACVSGDGLVVYSTTEIRDGLVPAGLFNSYTNLLVKVYKNSVLLNSFVESVGFVIPVGEQGAGLPTSIGSAVITNRTGSAALVLAATGGAVKVVTATRVHDVAASGTMVGISDNATIVRDMSAAPVVPGGIVVLNNGSGLEFYRRNATGFYLAATHAFLGTQRFFNSANGHVLALGADMRDIYLADDDTIAVTTTATPDFTGSTTLDLAPGLI